MKIIKFLDFITNNGQRSKHEREFDIGFFITNTLALFVGIGVLVYNKDYAWIAFLWIEYVWSLDNLRNNRNY